MNDSFRSLDALNESFMALPSAREPAEMWEQETQGPAEQMFSRLECYVQG